MMMVTCADCGERYDDVYRLTYCPHERFKMRTVVHRVGKPPITAHTIEQLRSLMEG